MAHDRVVLLGKLEAGRELAPRREQGEVRSRGRLEPMRLRLRDGDCPAGEGGPEGWLELAEGTFPLTIPLR